MECRVTKIIRKHKPPNMLDKKGGLITGNWNRKRLGCTMGEG